MQATAIKPQLLSNDQLGRYRADGYLAIENLLTGAEVEEAKRALAELVEGYAATEESERNGGRLMIQFEPGCDVEAERVDPAALELRVRKFMWFVDDSPTLKRLIEPDSAVIAMVSQIVGSNPIMFQDMALVKPPLIGSEKPWHQDNAYFSLRPLDSVCGVWIALDDATIENGCMHVMPGAHRTGALLHYHDRDCEIVPNRLDGRRVVPVPLPAGGALLFSGMLPHQTPPNSSPMRRRALQFHFRSQASELLTPAQYDAVFVEATGLPASCRAASNRSG